ncbi:hypothetical protein P3T25_007084 [Paraburkholderia sp. GAS32]
MPWFSCLVTTQQPFGMLLANCKQSGLRKMYSVVIGTGRCYGLVTGSVTMNALRNWR